MSDWAGMLRRMLDAGLSQLIADAIGLPEWAPRLVKRVAAALVVLTVALRPDLFVSAVQIAADATYERLVEVLRPVLDGGRGTFQP